LIKVSIFRTIFCAFDSFTMICDFTTVMLRRLHEEQSWKVTEIHEKQMQNPRRASPQRWRNGIGYRAESKLLMQAKCNKA